MCPPQSTSGTLSSESPADSGPTLSSLLAILRTEPSMRNVVNNATLDLMGKLLDSPNHLTVVSGLESESDLGLLLDFILCLLRDGGLQHCDIQNATRKARKMMDKLSEKRILPGTLFIDDINTDHNETALADFGSVVKGQRQGRFVALKMLYRAPHNENSLRGDFCREALAWGSLSHQFILPLLGIYEEKSRLFLVSPFMTNGTLIQWRKNRSPGITEIYRMMLEVAQGVQYIHSQGIVHGDLSGWNVLVDSEFHCQIADFGLTQYVESAISRSFVTTSINYTAPELFEACSAGCGEQTKMKTMEADVYAFGCLYYAIFFDTVPFQGKKMFQIMWLLANGAHSSRLDSPRMDDGIWNLIERCWSSDPSQRPTMEQVVTSHLTRSPSLLADLITELKEPVLNGSMISEKTLRLMLQVLDLPEYDTVASELRTTSDVELLLEFVLHLLRNGSLRGSDTHDANQKARVLMFKLISATNVMPSSLFIVDIKTDRDAITMGGPGQIFDGVHDGRRVALKVLYKGRHKEDSFQDGFYRDAVEWRSLSHRFVLPLLGIWEEKSHLILVSPFMVNGTLAQWRSKNQIPVVATMHRLIREVTEGLCYLHSEGIVHGRLNGRKVLLDSEFHCQITGFGFTQQSEANAGISPNFAAPELYCRCTKCVLPECDGHHGDHHTPDKSKTKETDVYAFGCFYYATFFDTIPFHGSNGLQVMQLVTKGIRPKRLTSPRMEDSAWNLIQSCWQSNFSQRPTMEQILAILTSATQAAS